MGSTAVHAVRQKPVLYSFCNSHNQNRNVVIALPFLVSKLKYLVTVLVVCVRKRFLSLEKTFGLQL